MSDFNDGMLELMSVHGISEDCARWAYQKYGWRALNFAKSFLLDGFQRFNGQFEQEVNS